MRQHEFVKFDLCSQYGTSLLLIGKGSVPEVVEKGIGIYELVGDVLIALLKQRLDSSLWCYQFRGKVTTSLRGGPVDDDKWY